MFDGGIIALCGGGDKKKRGQATTNNQHSTTNGKRESAGGATAPLSSPVASVSAQGLCLLVVGCWLLVVGCWVLAVGGLLSHRVSASRKPAPLCGARIRMQGRVSNPAPATGVPDQSLRGAALTTVPPWPAGLPPAHRGGDGKTCPPGRRGWPCRPCGPLSTVPAISLALPYLPSARVPSLSITSPPMRTILGDASAPLVRSAGWRRPSPVRLPPRPAPPPSSARAAWAGPRPPRRARRSGPAGTGAAH